MSNVLIHENINYIIYNSNIITILKGFVHYYKEENIFLSKHAENLFAKVQHRYPKLTFS